MNLAAARIGPLSASSLLWRDAHPLPTTWWGEIWRIGAALLTGLVFLGVVAGDASMADVPQADERVARDLVLGVAALLCLPARRRFPLPTALVTSLFTVVSASAIPASAIAIISLATHRRVPPLVVAAVPAVAAGMLYESLVTPEPIRLPWSVNLALSVAFYVTAVAIGLYIGARRDLLVSLRERAETAEREQAGRVLAARSAERARIAREMHDVLAHRISLVAMHAGALTYRENLTREETREAAEVIRDNAHQALGELREVLGVLRSDAPEALDATAAEPPQPTLTALDDLVQQESRTGARVHLTVGADLAAVPSTVSRNAYRILTEALTNARKHAPGHAVSVAVSGDPASGLTLRATNGLPTSPDDPAANPAAGPSVGHVPGAGLVQGAGLVPGAGLGLIGIRERAQLSGGRLTYGPDGLGCFVVEAWLPWTGEGSRG